MNRAACIGRTGVIRRDDPTFRISVKDSLWYGNGDVLPERVRDAFEPPAADDPSTAMAAPSSEFSTAIVRDSVSSLP